MDCILRRNQPSGMSHFAHGHLIVTFARHTCRILLMTMSPSQPPISRVAFCSWSSHCHICSSQMSHFAHDYVTIATTHQACHILCSRVWIAPSVTATHHACRTFLMNISPSQPPIRRFAFCAHEYGLHPPSKPPIKHVAFRSWSSHRHIRSIVMSHFAHGHLTVATTHQSCRIYCS